MLDVTKFVGEVHDYISRALNPLADRIKALEARAPVPGERGADGAPGKDGERGLPGADGRDGAPGKDGLDGKDGERGLPGADGKDGERGPPGENGKDGIDGKDGRDGKDADPIDMADVSRELLAHPGLKALVDLMVAEAVQAHFAANPVQHGKDGRDGRDGLPGKDGERGLPGADGAKGEPGEDGVGMAGGMIDVNGELILTTTKGDTLRLGKVVGKDGADGIGFDDLSFDYDGEREFSIKASKDGRVKEAKFTVPTVIDRGYWREGVKAKSGDGWTEGGHWWICKADTDSRPGHDNPAWRMGARAGKDRDTVRAKPAGGPVKLLPVDEE